MACAAAIFQVLAQVSFGSLLSDIVIANDWLILINVLSVCLSVVSQDKWITSQTHSRFLVSFTKK